MNDSPTDSDGPPLSLPKSITTTVAEWKELVTGVFTAIAALVSILVPGKLASGVAAACTLVAVPLLVFGYRTAQQRRRKQEEHRRIRASFEAHASRQAGFRGLTPYGAGERLPGSQRVREARRIVARLIDPDFKFGVLCGESGSGKSSMLRTEISAALDSAGISPVYIPDPYIPVRSGNTHRAVPSPLHKLEGVPPNEPVALLIDQFEEYLRECEDPEERARFGAAVQSELDARSSLRVLVALRREYLVDIRDLAPGLRDPLALPNLFSVTNFTVEEATEVIVECASRDGLQVDPAFARALTRDLSEEGKVRPPELQLVCTYLGDRLDEQRYQEAGGAAGILSHHVQRALSLLGDGELGARVLRALCDFSTRTRKIPQDVHALVDQAYRSTGPTDVAVHSVLNVLLVLQDARLVIRTITPGAPEGFALVHDYLVEAVDLATRGATTQREEASQQLRFLLATDERTISRARARFIRANADPALLETPDAQRLIRRSMLYPVLRAVGSGIAAITVGLILFTAATAGRTWHRTEVGRHWLPDSTGVVTVRPWPGGKIATGEFWGEPYVRVWDAATGALVWTARRGDEVNADPKGEFLITDVLDPDSASEGSARPVFIHLPSGVQHLLPPTATGYPEPDDYVFGRSGRVVAYFDSREEMNVQASQLSVYSLVEQKPLGSIQGQLLRGVGNESMLEVIPPEVTSGADRAVVLTQEGPRRVPALYDVRSGRQIALLRTDEDTDVSVFRLEEERGWVATVAPSTAGGVAVRLWSLRDGSLLRANELLPDVFSGAEGVDAAFSGDGTHLLLRAGDRLSIGGPQIVLRTLDLAPALSVPRHGLLRVQGGGPPMVAWWTGPNVLCVWEIHATRKPVAIPIRRDTTAMLAVDSARQRLLVVFPSAPPQLWDLRTPTHVATLTTEGRRVRVEFSDDENAVLVQHENDAIAVFDAYDGLVLTSTLPEREARALTYHRACRLLHVWNQAGVVSRYSEGRWLLGWFRASRSCDPIERGRRDTPESGMSSKGG